MAVSKMACYLYTLVLDVQEDKDEFGPGAGQQTESELVAKDDNQDPNTGEDKDDKKKQDQQQEDEEGGEEKTKELNEVDEVGWG